MLNRLAPHYILEESNFNLRYVRLFDLHIPREKWLNYMQAVETLIRRRILRSLIWVCTVCQLPFYGSPDYNGLKKSQYLGLIQYFCNIQVRSLINPQSANHNRSRRHSDVLYIRIIPEKIRLNIL